MIWLKTKCVAEDSFVIIGFQPGAGVVRTPLANIEVASFDGESGYALRVPSDAGGAHGQEPVASTSP